MTDFSNFEEVIDRRGTNSGKWDTMDKNYNSDEMIHLGVADMDFRSPTPIVEGFNDIIDRGVFGYTDLSDAFFDSIQRWYLKHHQMKIEKDWIVFCPRINIAASICIETYTNKGDGVILHTPAYGPLQQAILKNEREMKSSPLLRHEDSYQMDFEGMKALIDEKTKMMILCNPHNPTGRCWDKQEMLQIADFCEKHNQLLFSDEIHGDILKDGVKHTSALGITDNLNNRLILASSPAKTFNIPGVILSYMIIPNADIRKKIVHTIDRIGMHNPTIFAVTALEKAYTDCDDWYHTMKEYIDQNEKYTRSFFKNHFPKLEVLKREGTYLLWIDYSQYNCSEEELEEWFINEAKVSVYMGTVFGKDGKGYIRLNIASPKILLTEAYERMRVAWHFS